MRPSGTSRRPSCGNGALSDPGLKPEEIPPWRRCSTLIARRGILKRARRPAGDLPQSLPAVGGRPPRSLSPEQGSALRLDPLRRRFRLARVAAVARALLLAGWGAAQYSYLAGRGRAAVPALLTSRREGAAGALLVAPAPGVHGRQAVARSVGGTSP